MRLLEDMQTTEKPGRVSHCVSVAQALIRGHSCRFSRTRYRCSGCTAYTSKCVQTLPQRIVCVYTVVRITCTFRCR